MAATLPGYQSASLYGVFAPAKTPAAIISRLNREIVRFVQSPEAKTRFLNAGVESVGSTPEDLAAAAKADFTVWSRVVKDAGIKAE